VIREVKEAKEDIHDTHDGWGAPITSSGWDGEPNSEYARDMSLDASHDDNEEIDPNQDEYELESTDDADDADEDDDGSLLILWSFLRFSLLFTSCKKTNNDLCYSIDDQDPEVKMAKLNGLIGQKDTEIRELQN